MLPEDKCVSPPLISMKVEPKSKDEVERLRSALDKLADIDSHCSYEIDRESGETFIQGQDELQLDTVVAELLKRGIELAVGAPQIAYREKIARAVQAEYTYSKGACLCGFARVVLGLQPGAMRDGNQFAVAMETVSVPVEYLASIEKGVRAVWRTGVLIGFPLVDMDVRLIGVEIRDQSSSPLAFEAAAREAIREGSREAGIILLEPIMDIEVTMPCGSIKRIIADLDLRRAILGPIVERVPISVLNAKVPLANMFGFLSSLRMQSAGHATYRMTYSHYAELPRNIAPTDPDKFPPAIGIRA